MAQQREGTTDRLVNIIASIKLERMNGQLTAKRGEGPTLEEGTLIFVQGQITQANVGRRSGSDALNWLSTWRQTRYLFLPAVSERGAPTEPLLFPSWPFSNGTMDGPDTSITQADTHRREPAIPIAPGYAVPRVLVDLPTAAVNIERAGLSRSYRRLYLLIDEHRSIGEFALLIGKTAEEVLHMLHTLEQLGVIQIIYLPPADF